MPRERGEEYYTDQEFFPIFSKLNALFPQTSPWEETKARKEHKDLFGELIQPGEIYYKRQDGIAFDQNTKLSRLSMERLLHAMFGGNWGLNELAQEIVDERMKKRHEAHNRHGPFADQHHEQDKKTPS